MHLEPNTILAEFRMSIPFGEKGHQIYTTFGATITRTATPDSIVSELNKLFDEANESINKQITEFRSKLDATTKA